VYFKSFHVINILFSKPTAFIIDKINGIEKNRLFVRTQISWESRYSEWSWKLGTTPTSSNLVLYISLI
jgi:hypothetical protein